MAVFSIALEGQVRIEPKWIPRTCNEQADWFSRTVDYGNIHPQIFSWLDILWGSHTIDWLASPYNTHLPQFNSCYWNSGTEAVDAFTCNWSGELIGSASLPTQDHKTHSPVRCPRYPYCSTMVVSPILVHAFPRWTYPSQLYTRGIVGIR